ncbi:HAD-IA family hydrolase [Marinicellulosiphila megalodicopiae]|uniref:HAD-IA family hydrolase n=1 Tax=Marinicellulosiphila megalodicopiae TaxID=2724896 RepID=UPI003BB0ECD7
MTQSIINWQTIETVLLDMDGTLLDLHFDNYFWKNTVIEQYAKKHDLTLDQTTLLLNERFKEHEGHLNWYCLDFWRDELGLNIIELKQSINHKIQYLPGVIEFLEKLKTLPVKVVMTTNAHRDSIAIKDEQTQVTDWFDQIVSAHDFGFSKEYDEFWQHLDAKLTSKPENCVFIDDNLPICAKAKQMGIAQVFSIAKPDSTLPNKDPSPSFVQLNSLMDLFK